MIAAEQIKQLTSREKLITIEAIWNELLASGDNVESPDWHLEALKETEARLSSGLEEPVDWEQAKAKLRKEFE
jgi:hypothetical protein